MESNYRCRMYNTRIIISMKTVIVRQKIHCLLEFIKCETLYINESGGYKSSSSMNAIISYEDILIA